VCTQATEWAEAILVWKLKTDWQIAALTERMLEQLTERLTKQTVVARLMEQAACLTQEEQFQATQLQT
jgi:hypothetical protein